MATSSEDALGELYAWDSTIDEMYERGVDHADFDEDEAVEAYEDMIQVGAAPPDEAHGDAVLSLAAQLLTKHFYKFPHVHMNVVDVLLGLCAPARAQAVRIHTVRSLLQIVKAAPTATPPLVAACRARIADGVAALIQDEASAVLVRHLTQLQDTLAAVDADLTKAEKREMWKEKKELAKAQRNAAREDEKARRSASSKQAEDDEDRRNRSEVPSRSSKHSDRDERRREEIKREEAAKRERREARFGMVVAETSDRDTADDSKLRDARAPESSNGYDQKHRDSHREERGNDDRAPQRQERYPEPSRDEPSRERRPSGTKETGNGCPPSSFIFIGGVPRNTYPEDIINYLSCIDESVTYSCVQIKFPNAHPHAAGYAFVSLESVEHARKAIRHIQTTEFNGRNLIGDFARGPPCSTLQFVERNGSLGMHDLDAVLPVNGDTIDPSVWDDLCAFLKQYGSLDILRDGRIRFRDTESAKLVIRKHRIFIQGHEFLPVYDPEEQSEIDSSRRRRRSNDDGNHRRDEGASRYGTTDKTDRRGSRDDEDRKRRRSQSFNHDQKEKFPRHDYNDEKGDRHQHHAPREFDQARYGPRDSPSSSFKRRDETARSKDGSNRRERSASRERDAKTDHRSRDVQRNSTKDESFRGRSPVRSTTTEKRSSHHGRSRSRSQGKRFSENQSSPKAPSHRGRSPAASTSSARYGRGDNGDHIRERRDSSIAPRDEDRGGREWKSKEFDGPDRHRSHEKYADRTNRSRSPTKRHEYSDERRKQESTRRDHDERVSHTHRGRSHSPRRAPQSEPSDKGGHGRGTYKRDEPRHDDHRSRPFNRDGKSAFHKYGADYGSKDKTTHVPAREESQPSRFGGGERELSDRRGSSSQPMSKYGTVGGAERSPSPPHFGREESRNGREQNDRFSRGDEKYAQHGKSRDDHDFHRYGNENQSRENRDRPFRHDFNNHGKYHNENQQRGRSPPSKRTNDREEFNGGRHRSRSPSPVGSSGKRKHRSRSPHPTEEGGGYRGHRDHHDSRFNGGDRRRRDDQNRHFKRDNGGEYRSRYDDKYKADRARDDRRTHDRESATASSPRKSTKRDDERRPRSSSTHALRDQRTRTPSPMTFDVNMNDEGPATEFPGAPLMEKATSAYEDIDECMVDYEEDE